MCSQYSLGHCRAALLVSSGHTLHTTIKGFLTLQGTISRAFRSRIASMTLHIFFYFRNLPAISEFNAIFHSEGLYSRFFYSSSIDTWMQHWCGVIWKGCSYSQDVKFMIASLISLAVVAWSVAWPTQLTLLLCPLTLEGLGTIYFVVVCLQVLEQYYSEFFFMLMYW